MKIRPKCPTQPSAGSTPKIKGRGEGGRSSPPQIFSALWTSVWSKQFGNVPSQGTLPTKKNFASIFGHLFSYFWQILTQFLITPNIDKVKTGEKRPMETWDLGTNPMSDLHPPPLLISFASRNQIRLPISAINSDNFKENKGLFLFLSFKCSYCWR